MTSAKAEPAAVFQPTDLAYVGVFAALVAASALVPTISIGPVPITLQTLFVGLTGLCLGPWRGFAAVALYLVVGAAGLPIFSQGRAGIGVFGGPSGGYLIAFPFAAMLAGFVAVWAVRRGLSQVTPLLFLAGLLVARYLIILPLGVVGMMRALGLGLGKAFVADMPFWLGDLLKSIAAAYLAYAVHKAFPRLLAQR